MATKKNSLALNGIYLILYRLLNVLFPLVIATYISRTLLPSGVGKVASAQNVVTYFTFVAALGLPTYGTREIAKVRDNPERLNRLFSELISINAVSTTICAISYYTMILSVSFFSQNRTLYLVAGISILFNYINVDWLYQGIEQYKYIAIRSSIIKLLSLCLIFVLIKQPSDYIKYLLISCFVLAGNYILNITNARKIVSVSFESLKLRKHLKPLIILLASNIAIELYTLLDTTMLSIWTDDDIVAYYTNSMKISKIVVTLLITIASVVLPRLSIYFDEGNDEEAHKLVRNVIALLAFLTIPACVGLFVIADMLIPVLFGEAFAAAVPIFRILCVLIIPVSFNTFVGTSVLCASGKENGMLLAVGFGAVSNMIMNAMLIPRYQACGAAIASVISETIVLSIEVFIGRKMLTHVVKTKDFCSILLGATIMLVCILFIKRIIQVRIINIATSVLFGAVIYLSINLLLHNSAIWMLLNKIKKIKKAQCNTE